MRLLFLLFISFVLSSSILSANDFNDFKKALNTKDYNQAFDIYAKNINGNETFEFKNYIYKYAIKNIKSDTDTADKVINDFLEIEFNDNLGRYILSQIKVIKEEYSNALELLYELQNSYLEVELNKKVQSALEITQDLYLNSFDDIDNLSEALQNYENYNDINFVKKWHMKMLGLLESELSKEEYISVLQYYETLNQYSYDNKIEKRIKFFYTKLINNYLKQIEELGLYKEIDVLKSFILDNGFTNFVNKLDVIEKKLLRQQMSAKVFNKQIPLQKNGNKLFIQTNISGVVVNLLVDTGASITMLNKNVLASHSYTIVNNNQTLRTASGVTTAKRVMVDSLSIDDITFSKFEIVIAQTNVFDGFDGLLGMDFLGQFQFSIDKENSILYLN